MPKAYLLPGGVFTNNNYYPTELPLVNMYAEAAPTEPDGFVLMSRWALGNTFGGFPTAEYGTGPIRAIYRQDGVLGGDVVALSDDDLYVGGANKGTVPGTGVASIAGNEMGVVAAAGDDAKFYDGTTFRSITFPDSAKVTKVLEQQGRFIFLRKGSGRYYWTEPGANMLDMSGNIDIDALDYATAENEPDRLVDAIIFRDHLVLGGANTIEMHGVTLDDNIPWAPTLGSTISTGVRGTGCMCTWNNTFAWISQNYVVYAGTGRTRLSDAWVETIIGSSETWQLDSFTYLGREFLRVRLDDFDLVFHNEKWAKWATNPDVYSGGFIGGPFYYDASGGFAFGSKADGKILVPNLAGIEAADDFERIFRFGLPIDGGAVTINNVFLRCSKAIAANSTIEMRYSRDGGATWTSWIEVSLGTTGKYRTKVEWRSLGIHDHPGFLAECRVLDTTSLWTDFAVSAAYYNEPIMGRSRG